MERSHKGKLKFLNKSETRKDDNIKSDDFMIKESHSGNTNKKYNDLKKFYIRDKNSMISKSYTIQKMSIISQFMYSAPIRSQR